MKLWETNLTPLLIDVGYALYRLLVKPNVIALPLFLLFLLFANLTGMTDGFFSMGYVADYVHAYGLTLITLTYLNGEGMYG